MIKPGVYWDMSEEDYHAAPAISASGLKWLLVSPPDFWDKSWMNPDPEEDEKTSFMINGSAYHKRILEGQEAFWDCYAPTLDPVDYPKALRTADDLKRQLKELGLKVGGSKPDLINRLKEAGNYPIWDDICAAYDEECGDKIQLPFEQISQIQTAAAMIENHPQLAKAFTGGKPEVSIFWHDEENDLPCKCRVDYLKPRATVDLKSFSNPLSRPIDRVLYSAMANQRYHIQAAHYMEGVKKATEAGWIEGDPERTFLFVFQKTGRVPIARGRVFERGSMHQIAEVQIQQAKDLYKQYLARFGTDRWVDMTEIEAFDDTGFPIYMTE